METLYTEDSFIQESIQSLKAEGKCYVFYDWQVEAIRKQAKDIYNIDTIVRECNKYFIIEINRDKERNDFFKISNDKER